MKKILLILTLICIAFATQAQPGTLLSAKKVGADNNFQFFDTLTNMRGYGRGLCSLGDINGDGITDFAIGAVDISNSTGVVFILFMDLNGEVKSYTKITKNIGGLNTSSPNGFNEFGQSIANLGDLDGDGVVDIAVGNNGFNNSYGGEVYILFLNTDGTVKNHSRIASNVGGFTHTITNGQNFSKSIANIGDIDGDGVVDIAVGNHRDGDGGIQKGAVYILFLNSNGTVKKFQKISQTNGGFTDTIYFDGWFGSAVCSFDKNRFFVSSTKGQSPSTEGAIWLLTVNSNGIVQSSKKYTDTTVGFTDTLSISSLFGSSLAVIGDIDGDGISEIAIGAESFNDINTRTGALFIMSLDENDNIKFLRRFSNSVGDLPFTFAQSSRFGSFVSSAGDFNKDKKLDVIVASSSENGSRGRLNLLYLDGIEHELSASKHTAPAFEVQVFPNPATSHLQFSFGNNVSNNASVLLYDTHGRLLLTQQLQTHSNPSIDISNITTAGVYYLQIHCGGRVVVKKVAVER